MAKNTYSDKEIADYVELASEVGITRAKRQLGYPNSWATAKRWTEAAGIEIPLDSIKAQAAAHYDWYKAEELLIIAKEAMLRIVEKLQDAADLSADEQKKLAEAYQKYVNSILLLEGKATNITENRKRDGMDIAIFDLIEQEENRNKDIESADKTAE